MVSDKFKFHIDPQSDSIRISVVNSNQFIWRDVIFLSESFKGNKLPSAIFILSKANHISSAYIESVFTSFF
jgi:hypothetical protein